MGLKLFVRLMLLVLVLAMAGPFFLKGPDGAPLLTLADVQRQAASAGDGIKAQWRRLRGDVGRSLGNDNAGKVRMYRWQDADGQWHFSNEVPDGVTAETIYVDPDASRMDPVKIRPRARDRSAPAADGPIVNPLRAGEILDEVTGVRDQLEERQREQQRRLDNTD